MTASLTGLRHANRDDIPRLMEIRSAVQENRLSDPGSVTAADYAGFVDRGLLWVALDQGRIVGFSAGDDRDGTIWALFIQPADQGRGLGAGLLARACNDLAMRGHSTARLSTDPQTRAERFYHRHGWLALGLNEDGEVAFQKAL